MGRWGDCGWCGIGREEGIPRSGCRVGGGGWRNVSVPYGAGVPSCKPQDGGRELIV